jgi:hypothetical protein
VPEARIWILTSGFALMNSSATAWVSGWTVLDPSP